MKKQQPKVLINHKGNEVPINLVRPDHLKRNNLVIKIFGKAYRLQEKILRDKAAILRDIEKYKAWLEKHYDATAEFDNLTLSDYSNSIKVEIKSADIQIFDEKYQLGENKLKSLVKSWIDEAVKNANPKIVEAMQNIAALIQETFKTSKKGFLDRNKVFALKKLNIKDPEWIAAMKIIDDSIDVTGKRSYMMIKEMTPSGRWKNLNLNFSSAEVE